MLVEDPARGKWCVDRHHFGVWADASSLATGVLLEKCRTSRRGTPNA